MITFIKRIFGLLIWPFKFINDHFKAMIFLLLIYLIFADTTQGPLKTPNLVSIDLQGAIEDARPILEKIEAAKDDESIKGVLLHVNSPGGALAPSVELSLAIKELAKMKPVVAYAAGSMTSGSYYASIWSERIFANPGSFIGSIGVLFQAPNIKPLADKIGITEQVISAGEYKQAGTFTREWTEKERASLKEMIDDAYALFVSDVAMARKLDIANKDLFANAKVFLAYKAKEVGLIDEVGSITEAKGYLVKQSGVETPVWSKPDPWEKALQRLGQEGTSTLMNVFHGVKAY